MLVNRENLLKHSRWLTVFVAGTLLTVFYYFFFAARDGDPRWPGGSSPPGLLFGVVGGAIMLFEFLLWPRKKLRRMRLGKTQIWMRAHIWLGLLTIPLISLHAGLDWGSSLTRLLMVLFWIVIVSGVVGLVFQNLLPRLLLHDVPEETIYSQVEHVSLGLSQEAENVVVASCGGEWVVKVARDPLKKVVGARRQLLDSDVRPVEMKSPREQKYLREQFYSEIKPYLDSGRKSRSILRDPSTASLFFDGLKNNLNAIAHPLVDTLEKWCGSRRQLDRQSRIHGFLHGWLSIHLPLSVVLILLMFIHIFYALKYR